MAGDQQSPTNHEAMTPCIEFDGPLMKNGYARVRRNGKNYLAHRLAYCEHNGVSIDSITGVLIRHGCDNRACINGEHLVEGTHADNSRDMVERDRQAKHERHPNSVLTTSLVSQIRSMYVKGSSELGTTALADLFGVSKSQVHRIVTGKHWA